MITNETVNTIVNSQIEAIEAFKRDVKKQALTELLERHAESRKKISSKFDGFVSIELVKRMVGELE